MTAFLSISEHSQYALKLIIINLSKILQLQVTIPNTSNLHGYMVSSIPILIQMDNNPILCCLYIM